MTAQRFRVQLRRKLVVVGGDLGSPGLGLTAEDRATLVREVHYIVHSAASISFVDHIHNLISHNYVVSGQPSASCLLPGARGCLCVSGLAWAVVHSAGSILSIGHIHSHVSRLL